MSATRYLPFVGRMFIGLPFMVSGLSKLAAYGPTIGLITSSKLPLPAPLAYAGAVAVEVGCGLLMIVGYKTRVVAAIFAFFANAAGKPPDGRMIEEKGLGRDLQKIHQVVVAADVRQFVDEYCVQLFRA